MHLKIILLIILISFSLTLFSADSTQVLSSPQNQITETKDSDSSPKVKSQLNSPQKTSTKISADSLKPDMVVKQTFFPDSSNAVKPLKTPGLTGVLFRMFLALIFLTIVLYFGIYAMKRLSGQGRLVSKSDPQARVLDIFPINTKQAIYIVRLFDQIHILGVSPDNIQTLDKIIDPVKIEEIEEASKNKNHVNFKSIFDKLRKS